MSVMNLLSPSECWALTSCAVVCTVLFDFKDLGFSGVFRAGLDTAVANAVSEILHATQASGVVGAGASKLGILCDHVTKASLLYELNQSWGHRCEHGETYTAGWKVAVGLSCDGANKGSDGDEGLHLDG